MQAERQKAFSEAGMWNKASVEDPQRQAPSNADQQHPSHLWDVYVRSRELSHVQILTAAKNRKPNMETAKSSNVIILESAQMQMLIEGKFRLERFMTVFFFFFKKALVNNS